MTADLPDIVDGAAILSRHAMGSGHAGAILRLDLSDGRSAVAKTGAGLEVEAMMLRHLAAHGLPVPAVWHSSPGLLIMEHVDGTGRMTDGAEEHAAELLAALHGITADRYGFAQDTTIGPLPQPNGPMEDWHQFFAERRLLHMARAARDEGRLPAGLSGQVEMLCGKLSGLLGPPGPPSLLHGDIWGGNVLVRGGRVAAFIDPAIYHGDAEVELAFTTLFGTFGQSFFRRYNEIRPLRPGFFEVRRDVYNLYPLLVHVRLFGGSYVGQLRTILDRFAGRP